MNFASSPHPNELAPADAPRGRAASGSGLAAWWTLYVLTLRQHLHGKRWMVLAALFLLLVGLAILVRATARDVPALGIEFLLSFMFIPQAILPLVALIYASGMIQDEQEEQTITYLLIRPIPKWALYVVKQLATLTTTISLTVVFTVLTYAAIYVAGDATAGSIATRCWQAAAIHGLAVACYCCLFGLMSLLTKRTLIAGIVYTAIFEGVLANLPFGIRLMTVIYYTRLIAYRTLEFIVSTPRGRQHDIAAEAWQLNARTDPGLLEHPQFTTCLSVLLIGSLICTALAAFLCSQKEFHVKTPEKN